MKKMLVFAVAVALSLTAGHLRWGDSGHAIGMISAKGGKVRHPVTLEPGKSRYVVIATATVLPPYRGDARVALRGDPTVTWRLAASEPVVDVGLRRRPVLEEGMLRGLEPGDRVALWLELLAGGECRVCGMRGTTAVEGDREALVCSGSCGKVFAADPKKYPPRISGGAWTLGLVDTRTGQPVLNVPVRVSGKGGGNEAHH